MYERLMETPYFDAGLYRVAVAEHSGEMAASCTVWRCGAVALVEPVGCEARHRRRGLGSGVALAALVAAREDGAAIGIVRPRATPDTPSLIRLYRSIGFHRPGPHPGVPFLLMRSSSSTRGWLTQTANQAAG